MLDTSTEERLGPPQKPVRVSDILRALAVLAFGGYVIYTASQPSTIPLGYKFRMVWGGVMIVYGVYRLLRAFPFIFRKTRPNDVR